jgi:Divergent InlB B-repeat domain
MFRRWGSRVGFGVILVAALMFGTVAGSSAVPTATTTYTVAFTESGLPSATSWTVTFDGVAHAGTTATISVTGVTAGYYSYSVSNDIGGKANVQYATVTSSGSVSVPYEDKIAVVYVTQYYVTFTVLPVSSGTTTPGSAWYNAFTNLSIAGSAAVGYAWSAWSVSNPSFLVLSSTTLESTKVQINQPGTVDAHFSTSKYSVNFIESGLPTGTSWSVTFNSAATSGTTASLSSTGNLAGNWPYSVGTISAGTGVEYTPTPASGYINVPYQLSQEIIFVKQYLVTFSASPGGTGSTTPTGSAYYTAGSSLPMLATPSAGYVFAHWTVNESRIGVGSRSLAGTNATVKDTASAVADFATGTQCTTCTLTFREVGLPAKTTWGVEVNGYYYPTGATSLVLSGLTAALSWYAFNPVGVSQYDVQYEPVGTTSGYWSLGSTVSIEIVYAQYDYVTLASNPSGDGSATISSNWYAEGATYALSAIGSSTYKFSSWSSSGTNVTLGSASSPSTTMKVIGPATVTENVASPHVTLRFIEYGLPTGSSWGISLNSVPYFSSTAWINVTGSVYGGYSFSAYTNWYGVTGVQWLPTFSYYSLTAPSQTYQAIVFVKEVYVTFVATPTSSGYVSPSGAAWYVVGAKIPILAENVSGDAFSAWSQTAGTATIGSTSSSGTTAIFKAPGTITATFT